MQRNINIALCLSGGGFRATLFHLGVLKRLDELGLLARVRMLSAVSGGAVTAALFHHHVHSPYVETNPKNPENILNQFEKEGATLSYDLKTFETKLLQATKAGILGTYVRAIGAWVFFVLALFFTFFYWFLADRSFTCILLPTSIVTLLIAVGLYLSLIKIAWKYARQRSSDVEQIKDLDKHAETYFSSKLPYFLRALVLPFSPRMMRLITLDNLFNSNTCGGLNSMLSSYLGAVELNRGREMIFSNLVLTELGQQGSRDLMEQRFYQDQEYSGRHSPSTFNINWLPVAEAVAASSAFPPFFRPIIIRRGNSSRQLVGVFSDGGVIDNAALLAPIDMMLHCSQNSSRYAIQTDHRTGERIGPPSFEERISDILVVNAGAPAAQIGGCKERWPWFTTRLLLRILDIMQGSQEVNAIQKFWLMDRQTGPKFTAIKIDESEFPLQEGLLDTEIPYFLARIRTHFDAFDPVETATLVYSGYCLANRFSDMAEASKSLKSFRTIAKEVTDTETVGYMSKIEIVRHLRCSHLRLSHARKICRAVAPVMERIRNTFGW